MAEWQLCDTKTYRDDEKGCRQVVLICTSFGETDLPELPIGATEAIVDDEMRATRARIMHLITADLDRLSMLAALKSIAKRQGKGE